ncbi:MAG: response regulator [Aquabacterium sp.]
MDLDRVLIVDDSLTVRMDLQEAFEHAGFQTAGCATVAAAREALARYAPGVVVLDVRLPDGDGIELLEEIRSSPRHADAVVIMLSSESEVKDRVRGMHMGADEYVGKPYDTHHVMARVKELLRTRHDRQEATAQPCILIMDDSLTFRETLRQALHRADYRVELATSGEEGLRMAALSRPAAMLIDSMMPGIDGATVIRRVRLDVSLRNVPCVLMTGSDDGHDELRALEAGADAFVRKDGHTDVIVAKVRAALRSAATSTNPDAAAPAGPGRVLLLSDEDEALRSLNATLAEEGYDAVLARSGDEAMALLAVQPVDCIVLDARPELAPHGLSRHIKDTPILRDTPLIMLTPAGDHPAVLAGLSAGADDCLQKDGDVDVLKARVRAQIRRKRFEDENRRIRLELLKAELDASEARAARALAESRAELLAELERKNEALERVNAELKAGQEEIAKAYRELTTANEAKSEFLSTMSHELRTPLNAIIGFSYIMIDGVSGPLTPKQREFVGHIHEGGQHLLSLVNDILDLSKIEAGKVDIDPEPIHLDSLLQDTLSVVQEKAAARHVHLVCEGLNLPDTFSADRRRLKQILYNLLSNAVKFTPDHGMVALQATLVDRQQAAQGLPGFPHGVRMPLPEPASETSCETFVQITVTDNGIGIAPGDLDKLFKPFSQIKNELTRKVEGTGLGLTTVMRLAQLHGGTVGLSSQQGKGSCFCLWLPWKTHAAAPLSDADEAEDPTQPLVLVIEDDAQATALMSAQLRAAGFRVRHAISAEVALQMVADFTPDLITLDIRLPGMDGWDFLARVQDLPAWADVPVVVVSVEADHEIGISLGAKAVLQKPFGPHELRHELDRLGFTPPASGDITILLVDDDPRSLDLMTAFLRQPGYAILTASGGQEGIEMIRQHQPDLVVLDLLMPDIGGIEVVEALKQDPATAQIPVIMVTAKQFSDADRAQLSNHVLSVVNKAELHHDHFIGEVRRAFLKPALPA